MTRSRMMTLAVLIATGAGVTAATPARRASPLLPLSMTDTNKVDSAEGCFFSFETPPIRGLRRTMFYSGGNTLLIRTRTGLSKCRIPQKAFDAFHDAKGPITCGGQRLILKRTGKQQEVEEGSEGDGSSYPAVLTVGTGPTATTVRGDAGTGC